MMAITDGLVVIMCVFMVGFFVATHNPIMAVLAGFTAFLAWNHLAGQSQK
jgi:hypothetical protein